MANAPSCDECGIGHSGPADVGHDPSLLVGWTRAYAKPMGVGEGSEVALVLSPGTDDGRTGLTLACPLTMRAKGYPFEVALPDAFAIEGVVLADQVRCTDWRARDASPIGPHPPT